MYTITADQINQAAQSMSKKEAWGYSEYVKKDGEWVLDYILVVDEVLRESHKIYTDNRPSEIIKWAA